MKKANEGIYICHVAAAERRALAIYQHLTQRGCNAYLPASPDDEQGKRVNEANILGRGHFLVMLTPTFGQGDMEAVREAKLALESDRNVIPLVFNGFPLDNPAATRCPNLIKKLRQLEPLVMSSDYFPAAMERLQLRLICEPRVFSTTPLDEPLHQATEARQQRLDQIPRIASDQRLAEEWFELSNRRDKDADGRRYCLTRALEYDPGQAETWYRRGASWMAAGRHKRAIEDLDQALTRAPNHIAALHYRGLAHRALNHLDDAFRDFERVLELDPESVKALYNRAAIYLQQGEPEKAIEDYSRVLELRPDYARAYNNRAIAYRAIKRPDLAMDDYNKAIELEAENPARYRNRASLHMSSGNTLSARLDINRARTLGNHKGGREAAQIMDVTPRLRSRPPEPQGLTSRIPSSHCTPLKRRAVTHHQGVRQGFSQLPREAGVGG
jgi:tetratricopeptide (TPR) repeat protein